MKVTKIRIRNYRGIEAREVDVPPHGAIVRGRNGGGKTSLLKAVQAALAARDIGPDAIRHGADKAEIFVNIDDLTVERVITTKSSTVTVRRAGMHASRPQTYLSELLGTSPIDPLSLFLAKPKERKAQILAALPVTVTLEQLRKYAPEIDDDFDVSGHGLEVVERARKFFYDERTLVNRELKEAKANAERLATEAHAAAKRVTPGPIVPENEARAAVANAERTLHELETRGKEAAAAANRTAGQREQIDQLRAEASRTESTLDVDVDLLLEEVTSARAAAEEAESRLKIARDRLAKAERADAAAQQSRARIVDLRSQAAALENALAAATAHAPSEEEQALGKTKLAEARATLERAALQAAAISAAQAAEAAKQTTQAIESEASELDTMVKRLANDAPSELIASANMISGLSIEGDEVLLDGKRLDALCGAEQMAFAVEVARRANAKTKFIIVDGLERLDPEQLDAFVEMATRDDYQLIATRVDRGEVSIEAIEPNDHAAAAE